MIDLWVRYISQAFWGQDDALSFELPQSEESTGACHSLVFSDDNAGPATLFRLRSW